MEVTYDGDGRITVSDERFAHFLPALLGPSLLRAGGSAIKWLAGKALGTAKAAGKSAIEQMAAQVAAPSSELALVSEEAEGLGEGGEEEIGEVFDVYYDEANDVATLVAPELSGLSDEVADALAGHIAGYMDQEMEDGIMVSDSVEDHAYEMYTPDAQYAHFKKLRKKFKKLKGLAGKLGKIAGKLGPLGSLIPVVGQVSTAASLVGGLASKKGRRRAVQQIVPEAESVAQQFSGAEQAFDAFIRDQDSVYRENNRVDRLARMAGDVR